MSSNKLIKLLFVTTFALVLANIANELLGRPSWQINQLVNLSYEANIPTWFSSMLLAIAAFFGYKCSTFKNITLSEKRTWQLLALGLLGMSCDETATIHERLGDTLNKHFLKIEFISKGAWVFIFGPLILVLFLLFALRLKQYLQNSKKAKKLLLIGALTYISGAFILETILACSSAKWMWQFEPIFEESFEMFGAILFIKGLMEQQKFLLISKNKD